MPGQFWKDFIRETAPVFRTPTIEQLEGFIAPDVGRRSSTARSTSTTGCARSSTSSGPTSIVEDNVVCFPALPASRTAVGADRVLQPGRDPGPRRPAAVLRLPRRRPLGLGRVPRRATTRRTRELHADFDAFCTRARRAAAAAGRVHRARARTSTSTCIRARSTTRARIRSTARWHNLQASVRATDAAWELPEPLASGDGPLIYLSLGSLGSGRRRADARRSIGSSPDAPYRVIVSKGPQHDRYELAGNMVGAEFLPQTSILPQVDLVITHGGNNTVTESLLLRQADDRAAAVLGPVRQRAARARDRLRGPARHVRRTRPRS